MAADRRGEITDELLSGTLQAIEATLGGHSDDLREIKERPGILAMQDANLSNRMDLLDGRLERVERRLELIEG